MSTDNNPLPEAIQNRIRDEGLALFEEDDPNRHLYYLGYSFGATAEANRSLKLIEALRKIDNMCDHDDYGNSASNCPACIAHVAIEEYNNPLP